MESKYVKAEHPIILVDGISLDKIIDEQYPDRFFLGLIPTIVDWMTLRKEAYLVQRRFNTSQGIHILPILMCPDDCDLTCTLIVAEVEVSEKLVKWKRIGVDTSRYDESCVYEEYIGTEVEWLDKIPELIFRKEDYEQLNIIYTLNEIQDE
ncbi:hypothetical protein FHR92_004385 [Fontibacillus solani]|uniref:Uncharacterized protein n=1 Tax=Fontibacillus solani TaxID=1572857 RepID=A0A7W3SX92_9BACL|nr:hypothetical protein [Fontibacillus solani]MBA9087892.1 hypothetical protein [Fontibacillus solani]